MNNGKIEVGDIIITREWKETVVYEILGDGEYFKIKVMNLPKGYITMWVSKDIVLGVIPKQENGKTKVTFTFVIDNSHPMKEEVIDKFLDYNVDVMFSDGNIVLHKVHPLAKTQMDATVTVEPI